MSGHVSPIRPPLVTGNKTYHQITEDLISPTERVPVRYLKDERGQPLEHLIAINVDYRSRGDGGRAWEG